jgi:IS4 transposase
MRYQSIEKKRRKLKAMREKIESGQLNALRELLTQETIEQICQEVGYYFRSRLLSPLVIIFHMIGAAISRDGSFQSSWQLNGQAGQSGSLAKARKRLPLSIWKRLHQWIINRMAKQHESKHLWRGHRVVVQDGTCVSMSDEPALATHFGRAGTKHGPSRFPLARMVIAFNLFTLVTVGHEMSGYKTGEKTLARRLTPQLRRDDVIVDDRGFAGVIRYWELRQQGLHFINRAHQALRIDRLQILETFGRHDFLVKLPISKTQRRRAPHLPEFLVVRVLKVTARIRGKKETLLLVSSLVDPKKYPAREIRSLYRKRWRAETLIEELKIWLSADILRSKSPEGIHKEMYARIVASNLIHWLILEAAKEHRKKPERLSVSAALRLTSAYSLKMSTAPGWQLTLLFEELLEKIAKSHVPDRPNRIEPRMQKREQRNYPKLKMSRLEWRLLNAVVA